MKLRVRFLVLVLPLSVAVITATGAVIAQTGGPYDLSWNCAACTGGAASGGPYTMFSSIGQPGASMTMSGGAYSLTGGFLAYGNDSSVFLPLSAAGM